MIGKLIAYGDDRAQAMARMRGALRELAISGIDTNLPLHQLLLSDPGVIAGSTSIHYLEQWLAARQQSTSG
ncbi:Biotin carboxylase [compost metagenome]